MPEDAEPRDESPGEVVISNLLNRATVLLNYRLGDTMSLLDEACSCGRTLPLGSYLGRTKAAWLELGAGRVVHAQELRIIVRREQEIWRYQIVQESPRRFLVRLVPSPACEREPTSKRLLERFSKQLGEGVDIRAQFVLDIPRAANGKIEAVVPFAG